MEKDYFPDRSYQSQFYELISEGDTVYICEKHMQHVATNLDHLTKGIVLRKLTKHDHPRGIKCEVAVINERGLKTGKKAIGRVTYVVINGEIYYS